MRQVMESEYRQPRITRGCNGPFDSRAERGDDHNLRGCQMAAELGVIPKLQLLTPRYNSQTIKTENN